MVTKTITIMEDAYNLLVSRKNKNESFSEVIRKMSGEKKDIMKFAGAWKISNKESEKRKNMISKLRKESTEELSKRIKEIKKQ